MDKKTRSQNRSMNTRARAEIYANRDVERLAYIKALRKVRDDPASTPGEVLEAVKLMMELDK